jgi:hypothetical protein
MLLLSEHPPPLRARFNFLSRRLLELALLLSFLI